MYKVINLSAMRRATGRAAEVPFPALAKDFLFLIPYRFRRVPGDLSGKEKQQRLEAKQKE
jgi:hypothetical protein